MQSFINDFNIFAGYNKKRFIEVNINKLIVKYFLSEINEFQTPGNIFSLKAKSLVGISIDIYPIFLF